MHTRLTALLAADPAGWLVDTEQVRSSTIILLTIIALSALAGALYWLGVIDAILWITGVVIRGGIQSGFRVWEQFLSWASWPVFLAFQAGLLAAGIAAAGSSPALTVTCALGPLAMGLAACLAYMFIDVERYEVARGHKTLHDPMKGQRLAVELARHDRQVGIPLLASAAGGMIGGFALLNFGLYRMLGPSWYSLPAAPITYPDFVASALVHLLSVVDLLNLLDSRRLARLTIARPASGAASAMLTLFKSFFTLVLLQQIFASVRKGRLLAETIADFWSPHEPIHQRARSALPQYGPGALGPLLLSLRSAENLTREQREQLPRVIATIGPAAIPDLIFHLDDPNEHIRAVAISALGRLRATAALPRLAQLVNDPSDLARMSLAEALGEFAGAVAKGGRRPTRFRRRRGMGRLWTGFRRIKLPPVSDPAAIAVPALRTALADPAAVIRAMAAASLGRLGAAAAGASAPDLTALLADPDETVRVRAAESLGQVGAGDLATTVPALAGLLVDPSALIRTAAARALGLIGAPAASAVPALVPLLQDRDEGVRSVAADAVGRIGVLPGSSVGALSEGLESEDNIVRARTAEALGTIGEAAAEMAPALVEAMDDANDRVRAKAVEALGKMGEAAGVAVPRLVRALKDPDNWVSALAAEALGEMGAAADGAVPALVRSLRHQNPQVRANSAEALAKLGPTARAATPALERAVGDEDGGVRLGAIRALGEIGRPTPDSARVVRGALADPDPHARAAAAEAFGLWGEADEATRSDILGLLEDTSDEVKARTARVLPKLAEATPPVVEALSRRLAEDDSDWVRVEAARALGQLGLAAAPAGPALLRAAQTGEAGLREEAMRALAVAQPPEAAEAFTSGLRDAESQVRLLASAGWRKAAAVPEEAVPALIEALHDPEVQVRANAAHALSRLDPVPDEAVPLLIECAGHSDAGLRLNAALALQSVKGEAAADALEPLLEDPNPRLRLIAARRILMEDPADPGAVAALADALTMSTPGIRKAAGDLAEAVVPAAGATLDVLRGRFEAEADPAARGILVEGIERLEQLVKTPVGEPGDENKPAE